MHACMHVPAGEVGDESCIPGLAACLHESALCEAAEDALWAVFHRHPDPAVMQLMRQGDGLLQGAGAVGAGARYASALELFEQASRLAPSYAEVRHAAAGPLLLGLCASGACMGAGAMSAAQSSSRAPCCSESPHQLVAPTRCPLLPRMHAGRQAHNKRATLLYLMRRFADSIEVYQLVCAQQQLLLACAAVCVPCCSGVPHSAAAPAT